MFLRWKLSTIQVRYPDILTRNTFQEKNFKKQQIEAS